MGTICLHYETTYDIGDVVVFEPDYDETDSRRGSLLVGIITNHVVDTNAGSSVWYNIKCGPTVIFDPSCSRDVAEHCIHRRITDQGIIDFVYKWANVDRENLLEHHGRCAL